MEIEDLVLCIMQMCLSKEKKNKSRLSKPFSITAARTLKEKKL